MSNYDKYHIDRCDAMEYLDRKWGNFPDSIPSGGACKDVSVAYFRNWRFVNTLPDNNLVFANCLSAAITSDDLKEYQLNMRVPV